MRVALTELPADTLPKAPPPGPAWSKPQVVQFFCSFSRPAFQTPDGNWRVLPLPEVFGATESVTRQYLRACHPGAETGDPYEMPRVLGYSAGMPLQDSYPDFDALTRG